MKIKRFLESFFQLVLLGALFFGLVFILQNLRGDTQTSTSQDTPTGLYPPPSVVSSPMGEQPHQTPDNSRSEKFAPWCEFEKFKKSTEATKPIPPQYQFFEPRVILTSERPLSIESWLPDSQHLLITRDTQEGFQNIETYNIYTGDVKVYAERRGAGKPIWINELQAIVYPTIVNGPHELWIGFGDIKKGYRIASDVDNLSLATDGKDVIYFSPAQGDQPYIWRPVANVTQMLDFDLGLWRYPKQGERSTYKALPGKTFQAAWQPGGSQIAFYGDALLFFVDLATSKVCEFDLGEEKGLPLSALSAEWSPDGRYLAMMITAHIPGTLVTFSKLVALDIQTGTLIKPEMKSTVVYEFDWSPESQYLIALEDAGLVDGRPQAKLEIVDIATVESRLILPDIFFGLSSREMLDWSPDYRKIAINCNAWSIPTDSSTPTSVDSRICVVEVAILP